MFGSLRSHERDALAPLIALARSQGAAQRQAWLDDLRTDAPTVVARVEQLLVAEEQRHESSEATADARPETAAQTAVPVVPRPAWTAVPPQRPSMPDWARGNTPANTPPSPSPYSAPSLAVGGLRRRAGDG